MSHKITIYFFCVASLFFCFFLNPQLPEIRPFRPGMMLLGGIKSGIASLELKIQTMESEAVGVPTLKQELMKAQQDLAELKNKLGIGSLEIQIAILEHQLDEFALRFFKTAQREGVFLYNSLSEKLSKIFNSPEITERLDKIIRLSHDTAELKEKEKERSQIKANRIVIDQLKQEIKKRIENSLINIRELGKQIDIMTKKDQRGSNLIKTQIQIAREQLKNKLESEEIRNQLEPLEKKIEEIAGKIKDTLALRFSNDRLILMEEYRNQVRQYKLILEFLYDPSSIQQTTAGEILGYEKLSFLS